MALPFAASHSGRLVIVLALTATYMVVEAIGGWLVGSLALLADALHMLSDVFGLSVALVACWFATSPQSPLTAGRHSVGAFAALLNCTVVFATSAYILAEGMRRLVHPIVLQSLPMILVASVGLAINAGGLMLLRPAAEESVNVRGAYLQVLVDLLSSVAVIAGGLIACVTGWMRPDALVAILVGLLIIPHTLRLAVESIAMIRSDRPRTTEHVVGRSGGRCCPNPWADGPMGMPGESPAD